MVSPVLFVTKITTYAGIQQTLIDGCKFRIFPVVDSADTQLLIGTITRTCLEELLESQVGEAARREEAGRRVRKAIETIDMHFQTSLKEIFDNNRTKSESSLSKMVPNRNHNETEREEEQTQKPVRKESRFTVSPGKVIEPPLSTNRRNSLTRRNAFCSLEANEMSRFKERDEDAKSEGSCERTHMKHHLTLHGIADYHTLVKSYMKQAKKYLHYMQFGYAKPERRPMHMYDLSHEEQKEWESARLSEEVDLTDDIDQAPFQIVRKTSLFNIHSIFSMLQLSRVFVTEGGRLVGVVALSDVRRELERSQEKVHKEDTLVRQGIQAHAAKATSLIRSTSEVVDILTPTLEVIKSTAFAHAADDEAGKGDIYQQSPPSLPKSHARRRSTYFLDKRYGDRSMWGDRHRASFDEHRHEGLVEAVAYLRKKSLAPDHHKFPHPIDK